jgi:hypothetical protein
VKRLLGVALVGFLAASLFAACDGDDGDGESDATTSAAATRRAGTASPSASRTAGTPGADGTASPGGTSVAPDPNAPPSDPNAPPADPNAPPADPNAPPVDPSDPALTGGDPNAPPEVVNAPTPPPQAEIDPTIVAPPEANISGIEFLVDLDASEPGIQSTRSVDAGDVIRVAVVLANVPSGGVGAFNFRLIYDNAIAVAPSIEGGPTTDRNPDMNDGALGGEDRGWACAPPAPVGDMARASGSTYGDDVGDAFLSCYSGTGGAENATGDVALATVELRTVAGGSTAVRLENVALYDPGITQVGGCPPNAPEPIVPCREATLTVN